MDIGTTLCIGNGGEWGVALVTVGDEGVAKSRCALECMTGRPTESSDPVDLEFDPLRYEIIEVGCCDPWGAFV